MTNCREAKFTQGPAAAVLGAIARLRAAPAFFAAALGAISVMSASPGLAVEPYRLAGGEKMTLRMGTWNATDRRFEPWAGVEGVYTVAPDGVLSVPIAGALDVTGALPSELAEEIAGLVQRQIGLEEPPFVTVEVESYGQVFVGGVVASPGSYEFRPFMSVEQALTLAGGLLRGQAAAGGPVAPAVTRLESDIARFSAAVKSLEDAKERLETEIAVYAEGDLTKEVAVSDARHDEVLAANLQLLRAERDSNRDLQKLLHEEIAQLSQEIDLRDSQIAAAREDLEATESLKDRGLAVAARVNAAASALSNHEAKRIQLEVARVSAQQELNLAVRNEATMLDRARQGRLVELQSVERDLTDTLARLELSRQLYAEELAVPVETANAGLGLPIPRYRVSRRAGDAVMTVEVGLADPLLAGDMLTVSLEVPAEIGN